MDPATCKCKCATPYTGSTCTQSKDNRTIKCHKIISKSIPCRACRYIGLQYALIYTWFVIDHNEIFHFQLTASQTLTTVGNPNLMDMKRNTVLYFLMSQKSVQNFVGYVSF